MRRRHLATFYAAVLALTFCARGIAQTEPPDRLLAPIVAAQRTTINLVHPLAAKQNDLGRVSGAQVFHRMILILQRSAAQEAALQQLLRNQQDPASPEYHRWLTPAEFGQRFGPSRNDMARIGGWLAAQGFSVEKPSNGRQFILFTGTSAQVESAFQTQMHRYGVNGKTYMANSTPASIPTALAPDVRGIASLTTFGNFKPQSYPAANPKILIGQEALTGPADLDAIYDAAPLQKAGIEGQGESIALIEESDINLQDLTDFRNVTGLPAATVNIINNGPDPGLLASDGEEFEAIADVEYAGAMAPDATLNVIVTESTEFNQGIDLSTVYAVDYDVSPITSLSYGGCETLNDTFYSNTVYLYGLAYEQGAAEGISHFVSSGDNGGDDCEYTGLSAGYGVNAIGDSPYNVSAGGTEFIMPDPYVYFPAPAYTASGYIPESTWNDFENPYDGRPLAGNGGVSINFSKPSWQAGPGVPADGQRDTPDVSLLAGDNLAYLTCERDLGFDCAAGYAGGVIGTSLASPNWAAIQALVDQKNNLVGGAGNPNPVYYKLAAGASSPFHDITVGDTKIPDPNGELVGYAATPGFDLATGLGSVDVNKLATGWAAATGSGTATVTLSTGGVTTITHGDPLTVSVTVTSTGSAVPSGDVAILAGTEGVSQLTLSGGAASAAFGTASTYTELPGGSYNLKAQYAGDTNFAPATSNTIAITVNPEPTATTVSTTTVTAIPYGTPVTIAAFAVGLNSVANLGLLPQDGFPVPGAYSFTDTTAGTSLGTASIARTGENFAGFTPGTTANLTLTGAGSLAVGTHSIAASSPASASFLSSTSGTPVAITVSKGSVLVSLTPNHTTPALDSTVNLLVSVLNGEGYDVPVTGSVQVYDESTNPATLLGTGTLPATADSSGAYDVTLPVTFTVAGAHVLLAIYNGDANDYGNESGAVDVTVSGKAASTTTMTGGQSFGLAGNSITFSARVVGDSGGTSPTGTVTFTDAAASNGSGAPIGTAGVASNGVASLTIKTLAGGLHFITANYGGDANYNSSGSQSIETEIGDFTLASSPGTATVAAGQASSAITLTYAGTADFSQQLAGLPGGSSVLLTCSGLPSGANCAFSPSAIVPTDNSNGTTSGTAAMTITTEGPTLVQVSNQPPRKPWAGSSPLALAGLLALGLPLAFRRRRYFSALLGAALLAVVSTLGGCNGSLGGQYNVTSPGTPAGTSTVTVTATLNGGIYGTLAHTATVTLTVTAQ